MARLFVVTLTATTTAVGTAIFVNAVWGQGPSALILLATILFAIGTTWIALAFWTAGVGFWARRRHPDPAFPPPPARADPNAKTVVAIAVCNEDPDAISANIEAMLDSTRMSGVEDRVDFFILSDTTDSERRQAEQRAWSKLARQREERRVFYRHRIDRTGRKSGNIAEFCRRWGRRYRYMIVLDADSLMEGETIAALMARMDAAPRVALMQTAPALVNGESLFTRLLQFAGGIYGPVFTAGLAAIAGNEGNSWGHNAIIRVSAFMTHCGLPRLSGHPPFGGDILSHDFVEAALLVRAGWEVRIVTDLGGSFEECPGTIGEFVRRDRRWCQGNLQHLRLLNGTGLTAMSRFHLLSGIMSYAISPVWLGFIGASLLLAAWGGATANDGFSFAGPLMTLIVVLLVGPRIMGLADCVLRGSAPRAATLVSTPLEIGLTALLAPILMVHQSLAVVAVFCGRAVGWATGPRQSSKPSVRRQLDLGRAPVLIGMTLGGLTLISPAVAEGAFSGGDTTAILARQIADGLVWAAPIVGPLLGAPLLIITVNSRRVGMWTRRVGLFVSPSERIEAPIVRTARQARERASDTSSGPNDERRALANPAVA